MGSVIHIETRFTHAATLARAQRFLRLMEGDGLQGECAVCRAPQDRQSIHFVCAAHRALPEALAKFISHNAGRVLAEEK